MTAIDVQQRYVGLRITKPTIQECLSYVLEMEIPNPYIYAFHDGDSGCKHPHAHFAFMRDWDPACTNTTNAMKFRRAFVQKTDLKGNDQYAISFHSNKFTEAGNYLSHGGAKVKFSKHKELDPWRHVLFEYVDHKRKRDEEDLDIHKRRREVEYIPLTYFNLVPTMRRYDRINNRPKRPFNEAFEELYANTRYRLDQKLSTLAHCPPELILDYENPPKEAARRRADAWAKMRAPPATL